MAFREVASLDTDNTVGFGKPDPQTGKKVTTVEGYYIGSKKVESKKAKSGFAYLHVLSTSKGNLGVWGKTDLDRKILQAPVGAMVRVTHTGMQETPNGSMYKFKVEVDTDNTTEVDLGNEQDASDDLDGESYGAQESGDEDTPQVAALSAKERLAQIQAKLNSKSKKV